MRSVADVQQGPQWPTRHMSTAPENTTAKIRLPADLHRALRMVAAEQRRSVSDVAREIFREALPAPREVRKSD